MRLPIALTCLILWLGACSTSAPAASSAAVTTSAASAPAPAEAAEEVGEQARWTVEGDTVHVNNHLCAVSHSPLDVKKLDKFQSRVAYTGDDPRFKGKEMVFNQCCAMCIQSFPGQWEDGSEAVLKFHGLAES